MARRQSARWRRAANSAAFSVLLVLVLVLGYLALTRVVERGEGSLVMGAGAEPAPGIQFDRFSARRERSSDGERLTVSLRLRSTLREPLTGFLFIVARNDHVAPRLWSIWPPESRGLAITPGGHFHGATPAAGQALSLTDRWERFTAVLPYQDGQPPYDTVILYVVSPKGQILLSRPFGI